MRHARAICSGAVCAMALCLMGLIGPPGAALALLVVPLPALVVGGAAGVVHAAASSLAAGGLLAMLTNSLIPFAFQRGGLLAGVWTVIGFAAAVALL